MDPDRCRFTQAHSSSQSHGLRKSRLVLRTLYSLSFVAIAGCSDRDAPTAVLRQPPPPTRDVIGADYVVTTTADAGAGSLRQAIIDANAAGVAQTIGFDIPDADAGCSAPGNCTITLGSTLPEFRNRAGITVDGTGQSISVSGNGANRVMTVIGAAVVTLKRLTITRGFVGSTITCSSTGGSGAGVCNEGALTVIESTFSLNSSRDGAAIAGGGGTSTIIGSTFVGNQSINGGAIRFRNATGTITNSTFSGNTAGNGLGGAILVISSTVTVSNTTFTGNSAFFGNNLTVQNGVSSLTLRNNILAQGPTGSDCERFGGTITDGGGNLRFGGGNCPGIDGDPKLGPLQINAPGLTATHALLDGSAAIGAAVGANCPAVDQRGVSRPYRCDIGAYESPLGPTDATAPMVTPTIEGTLGSEGWYTSDVTVNWSVTDEESAITSAPCAPTTISADTPGQAVSCSATSDGGPRTQTVTIKRDVTAPTLAPVVSPNPVLLNATATATPNATDAGSGVASASCLTPNTASVGSTTVECTAIDRAGNSTTTAAAYSVELPPDGTPPVITPGINGRPGENGWYTSDVTVVWTVSDAESSVGSSSGCETASITTDADGQTFTCTATSRGGTTNRSVTIKRDVTAPAMALVSVAPSPNAAGWNNTPVTVTWTCGDVTSGVAGSGTVTVAVVTEGRNIAIGECTDNAGNRVQDARPEIKIDRTAPSLAPLVSPNRVLLSATATATPNASDELSGLASSSCGVPITSSVGSKTVSCTATDYAGNTRTVAASYAVIYDFTGFLQPVDPMPTVNVVKAGAAVQVNFGIGGNQGLGIFSAGSPASQPVSCAAGAPQDDIEATVTAGNSSLSYDPTTQLYAYTWKTDKTWAGTCRMLSVKLVDGTTYQASFRLK